MGSTIGILESKRYHPFPGELLLRYSDPKLPRIWTGAAGMHILYPVIAYASQGEWQRFAVSEAFVLFNLLVILVFALVFLREARTFTPPEPRPPSPG